jgi:hypothetical protein
MHFPMRGNEQTVLNPSEHSSQEMGIQMTARGLAELNERYMTNVFVIPQCCFIRIFPLLSERPV